MPRFPSGPAILPGGIGRRRLFQHPHDFLPGDRQPRDLLFRPGQVSRKLLDPGAQPVRLSPGSRFPALEFLDHDPIRGLLPLHPTVEDHIAGQPEIRQSSRSEVPSDELHPNRIATPTWADEIFGKHRAGDTLVVWKLDRLGRSVKDVLTIADDLHERGVGVRILTGKLSGTYSPAARASSSSR